MDHEANKPVVEHLPKLADSIGTHDLWAVETYFRDRGGSEFLYDGDLDVFRFPEDGSFAFCDEFANWNLLRERGYLDV
jgi:hypothetical protein